MSNVARALLALGYEASIAGDDPKTIEEYEERVVIHGPERPPFAAVLNAANALPDALPPVTVLQFALGLWRGGYITPAEAKAFAGSDAIPAALQALIDQLPAEIRDEVEIRAAGAMDFRIEHPFVQLLAQKQGWSRGELAAFWNACLTL